MNIYIHTAPVYRQYFELHFLNWIHCVLIKMQLKLIPNGAGGWAGVKLDSMTSRSTVVRVRHSDSICYQTRLIILSNQKICMCTGITVIKAEFDHVLSFTSLDVVLLFFILCDHTHNEQHQNCRVVFSVHSMLTGLNLFKQYDVMLEFLIILSQHRYDTGNSNPFSRKTWYYAPTE